MHFEFDGQGYVKTILYGCYTGQCIEYTGLVPSEPEEYADMDDWADNAKVQAYYLNEKGNLTYDAARAESLCAEDEVIPKKYTTDQIKAMGIFDAIYPVGSLYISMNDVSPAILFGGTWQKIEERFLIGASENYPAGEAGGSTEHQHTSPNGFNTANGYMGMSFRHGEYTGTVSDAFAGANVSVSEGSDSYNWKLPKTDNVSHMPPYLPVHMWQRMEDPVPEDYQNFITSDGKKFYDANAEEFMVEVS